MYIVLLLAYDTGRGSGRGVGGGSEQMCRGSGGLAIRHQRLSLSRATSPGVTQTDRQRLNIRKTLLESLISDSTVEYQTGADQQLECLRQWCSSAT